MSWVPGGTEPVRDDRKGGVVSVPGGGGEEGMVMEGKGEGEQLFLVFVAVVRLLVTPPTATPPPGGSDAREAAWMRGGGGFLGP